jgi:hypothetical protein
MERFYLQSVCHDISHCLAKCSWSTLKYSIWKDATAVIKNSTA